MPGVGVAAASRKTVRGGGGAKAGETQRLCGVVETRDAWLAREGEAHALEVAGADSGTGAELHPEACNSWRVEGGVRARLPRAGSGKEAGPASSGTGERFLGARVARDWLGGRGAGAREARTQQPRRGLRQKQSPAELAASSALRRLCPRLEPLRTRCGSEVASAPRQARENLEVA